MDQVSLMWHWSYQQQINIFDANDAYWIKCAENRWDGLKGLEEFKNFLVSYGLLRGVIGKYFSRDENLVQFIKICNDAFFELINFDDWSEAQTKWNDVTEKLKNTIGSTPASAVMKAFWFYHPKNLPMYDQYVLKALSRIQDKKITHSNYLLVFGEFYEGIAFHCIQEIDKHFSRKYISWPRVADKYLWLEGSDRKDSILRNYRCGLEWSEDTSNK